MAKLEKNVELLQDSEYKTIELYAYTDNTGTLKRNLIRSEERAKATSRKLIELGIPAEKIKIFPKGKTNYIANNSTKQRRLLNRRIEFKVIH